MLVNGTTSSRPAAGPVGRRRRPAPPAGGVPRAGRGGGRHGDRAGDAGHRRPARAPRSITDSTSARVIRPPRPVPRIDAGSMPVLVEQRAPPATAPGTGDGPGGTGPVAGARGRRPVRAASVGVRRGTGRRPRGPAGRRRRRGGGGGGGGAGGAESSGRGRGRGGRRQPAVAAGRASAPQPAAGAVAARVAVDDGQGHAHVDRVALLDQDGREDAVGRGGHLGVDLVGGHLEQRLVTGDRVADRLEPLGDGPLGHGLAELRHGHVRQRAVPFRSVPAPSRRRSRTATGAAGRTGPPRRRWPPS